MRLTVCILSFFTLASAWAQPGKPKLVVGIVVDQMRQEYLLRFDDKFSEDGFKKIQREGFAARNAHFNYIPTYTAPGHAAIYTGTTPRYNGIIGNNWYSRPLDRSMYCVGDSTAKAVGGSERGGAISPRNLIVNTITDELKLSTNFRSKVVGVSIKDRGAVLPAGHTPEGAYWYDSRTGEFMTSDFYMDKLPDWVVKFNQRKLVDQYASQVWNTLLPLSEYVESTPDNTPYENGFKGKDTPTFPYDLKALSKDSNPYSLISSTPFGNSLVLEMGKAAIEGENMGQDDITDFLAISFSTPDYVGHNFGPNSVEVQDIYLRLDRDLAELLSYLDSRVGKGNYLLFLSSDHGVVANPQFLIDHRLPGGYIDLAEAGQKLQQGIAEKLGKGEWILDVSNDQIFLDRELIAASGKDLAEVQRVIAGLVMELEPVAEAFAAADFTSMDYTDPLHSLLHNGFNPKLSGDVLILMKAGYLANDYGAKGTSHGTGYTYDTHIPILFYGQGVRPGSTVRKVTITDIAPTLSMLLNISMPNGAVTGQPIIELFE